jgi:prepilin-type N-terminal cleavage/methylation domain-containing protein
MGVVVKTDRLYRSSAMARSRGFSLIELLLAIGILGSIAVFSITMLGTQVANRNDLTLVNESQHTLHSAMTRIYDDLRHAYLPTKADAIFGNVSRRQVKPMLSQRAGALIFSSHSYQSLLRDSGESNMAMIKYTIRKSPDSTQFNQLIRTVDTDFVDSIESDRVGNSLVLVPDLKSFKVTFWDGQDFREDWNTEQSDSQGTLPKMAKIELAIFRAPSPTEKAAIVAGEVSEDQRRVMALEAIVYLMYSKPFEQVKTKSNEYTWR